MNRTRRRVIQLAGCLATTCALGRPAHAANALEPAGLFIDPEDAAAIGHAYLRAQPAPGPTLISLRHAIFDALGRDDAGRPLAARFRACVREDFEVGRVVMVDGWMLSRVEAKACALVSLSIAGGS